MKARQHMISRNKPMTLRYETSLFSTLQEANTRSLKTISTQNILESKSDSLKRKINFQKDYSEEGSEILSNYLDHIDKQTQKCKNIYLENHFREEKNAIKYLQNSQKNILLNFNLDNSLAE